MARDDASIVFDFAIRQSNGFALILHQTSHLIHVAFTIWTLTNAGMRALGHEGSINSAMALKQSQVLNVH